MIRSEMSDSLETPTIQTTARPSQSLRRHFLSLARQVQKWAEDKSIRTLSIGVTRLDRQTGSSTVAFNLTSALSSLEQDNVLFVEADFGDTFVFRKRNTRPKQGLADVLNGTAESHQVIRQMESQKSVYVMAGGPISERESIELPLGRLPQVISDQLDNFSFVVFDLPISDGLSACDTLASGLDGVILVVENQAIYQHKIVDFQNRMRRMGVEVIGLVVNKTKR